MILPSDSDVLEYSSAKEKCRRHAALLQRAAAAAFLELTISIASVVHKLHLLSFLSSQYGEMRGPQGSRLVKRSDSKFFNSSPL